MFHERPERFDHRPSPALYELIAPAILKARGDSEEKLYPSGSMLEVVGLPVASLRPRNGEAAYAKYRSIEKSAMTPNWYAVAIMTAVSLGARASTYEDAAMHVQQWLDDYRLNRKGARRGF
ncbi:hypothetical protein ACVWW4_000863 [Bradyrhizobium sp. LB7.1]